MRGRVLRLAIVAAALLAFGSVAKADSASFNVTSSGSGGQFGSVTYTLSGSSINVAVAAGTGYQLTAPNGVAFGFNVVGSTSGLTVTNVSTGTFTLSSNQNVSTFGLFDFALSNLGVTDFSSLSFTVSTSQGFSSADQLCETSSAGDDFAAHLIKTSTGAMGYVAADAVSESWGVSDSLGLFALVLVAFGILTRLGVLRPVLQ